MSVGLGLALVIAGGVVFSLALTGLTLATDGPTAAPCRNCDPQSDSGRHHCVACRPELALAHVPEQ